MTIKLSRLETPAVLLHRRKRVRWLAVGHVLCVGLVVAAVKFAISMAWIQNPSLTWYRFILFGMLTPLIPIGWYVLTIPMHRELMSEAKAFMRDDGQSKLVHMLQERSRDEHGVLARAQRSLSDIVAATSIKRAALLSGSGALIVLATTWLRQAYVLHEELFRFGYIPAIVLMLIGVPMLCWALYRVVSQCLDVLDSRLLIAEAQVIRREITDESQLGGLSQAQDNVERGGVSLHEVE